MTIKKFQGKTEEEAAEKARLEFGSSAVIMNVKQIKPTGLFKSFKSSSYEVTAAVEEIEEAVKRVSLEAAKPGNIDIAADEEITLPRPEVSAKRNPEMGQTFSASIGEILAAAEKKENQMGNINQKQSWDGMGSPAIRQSSDRQDNNLEEKLENLQSLLEKKFVPEEAVSKEPPMDENFKFLKMIYGILLDNEVDEKYVNQIMDEVEKVMRSGFSVDHLLSSIYQKMILKFGQSQPIELTERRPKIVFFIGPTGVGKTTTIAKIASRFKMEKGKKVALLTADTYRIAAADQLRTYANILEIPLNIVYSPEELAESLEEFKDYDLILIDTAGFSHKNEEQRDDIETLIDTVKEEYEKEVYLVLSATTKYRDLIDIADSYKENFIFKIIFTKLDETSCYGNMLNMKLYTGASLAYATYGQNVPEDIEIFNTQKVVKLLLGGK